MFLVNFLHTIWSKNLKNSLYYIVFFSITASAQVDLFSSSNAKQLAIQSAQLAHQSHQYTQKSYFSKNFVMASLHSDTAISFIKESILLIDSALLVAPEIDTLAIEHAYSAKEIALSSYQALLHSKKYHEINSVKDFYYSAMHHAANVTSEAYTASLYFGLTKLNKEVKKKEELKKPEVEKVITKLDIDHTLFTILKQELEQKKTDNAKEITALTEALFETNNTKEQAKLKTKLKELDNNGIILDKKNTDAGIKLKAINDLLEERSNSNGELKSETVFAKSIPMSQEWSSEIKSDDSYLPQGLVYQVQLGVYKNTVLPTLFKGLNPIYGKKVEQGVSYSTGLFERFAEAKEAKNYVVSMGLNDAFIVAFYNKKKISIAEAIKLEK